MQQEISWPPQYENVDGTFPDCVLVLDLGLSLLTMNRM